MSMMRKEAAGHYIIGIYEVMRDGKVWRVLGRDFGFDRTFTTLHAAYLYLTGEAL